MGDVLSLIEKAEQNLDSKKAEEMEKKLRAGKFTLADFLDQMEQVKGMGNMQDMMGMIPGIDKRQLKDAKVDEKAMSRTEAMILSMTPYERENPEVLNSSRKRRIALGSGTKVEDLNRMLKQYEMMKTMVKQMSQGKMPKGFMGGR